MNREENAVALHKKGYNCAQCLLMGMTDFTGLTEELSASLTAGLGGGAGCRELCGAVSGSILAVGASLGADSRPQILALDRELTAAFRENFGALRCADLKAAGKSCDELIAFAAKKTGELLEKAEK